MLLKKSASLLTIVAMAMSVGSATAANLLVDDFSNLGTLPSPATTNVWNVGGISNIHGGTREQNKAGTGTTYSNAGGHLRMSTTGTGTGASWDIIYDGVLGANPLLSPAFTSFPNPSPGPINASGMTYLNVLMPRLRVAAREQRRPIARRSSPPSSGQIPPPARSSPRPGN